jgi:hypothetical protein
MVLTGTNKIGVGGETVPSVEKLFTINAEDVKNGKHYYNWFSRMMIEGDYFFRAVGDNYNNGKYIPNTCYTIQCKNRNRW